jgi:hypothetical protein
VGLKDNIDWLRETGLARVLVLAGSCGHHGDPQRLPWAAALVLCLFALAFGSLFASLGRELIQRASSEHVRRGRAKNHLATLTLSFFKLEGACRNGADVQREATQLIDAAVKSLERDLGYAYAVNLKMADRPKVPQAIIYTGEKKDLLLRLQARKEYLIEEFDAIPLKP